MPNNLKRCSASYVIVELQITIMRYHYTPIRMVKVWNSDNTKCWWGCGTVSNSHIGLVRTQNHTATLKDSLVISYKTKHVPTIWSRNHTPWYYSPKGVESLYSHKNLHMDFRTAFFIIPKTWKQPRMSFSK